MVASFVMLPSIANAQIVIKEKTKIETIKSLRLGNVRLECSDEYYMLTIASDNSLEEPYVLALGLGKAQAAASLKTLISLSSSLKKNEFVDFTSGSQEFTICRGLVKNEIWLNNKFHVGRGRISKNELDALLDSILFCN